jgi:hypothetical protein
MVFMLTLCWRLSMVPFIVVPVIMVASKIFGVYYDFLSEKTQEAVAHSNDVVRTNLIVSFASLFVLGRGSPEYNENCAFFCM